MKSQVIALLVPAGSRRATLLVRRGDGQFALERIDTRVAHASRVAASYSGTKVLGSPFSAVPAA